MIPLRNNLSSKFTTASVALLAALSFSAISHAATVTWTGVVNSDPWVGLNWDNNLGLAAGDHAYINSGTVDYSAGDTPSLRSLRLLGGTLTLSGGQISAAYQSSQYSIVNGNFFHTGGSATINALEIGNTTAATGVYQLNGGDLNISRGLNDYSLYIGGDRNSSAAGTGTFQVLSGSLITRTGVKLGDASAAGIGTFEVRGSEASSIDIGSQNSLDGWWLQNSGSTLKVSVDSGGLTKIFIDDVEEANATHATFESGSLLDVDYYNAGGPGTWTVMEVENGDVTDNGLAFAAGVDTSIWSFNIDNSGANGLLTVTSTASVPTAGDITWDGSESNDWNDGRNWNNSAGPVTAADNAIINSGSVLYTAGSGANLNKLLLYGGSMTISDGLLRATNNSNRVSIVNGTLTHTGGAAQINSLAVGNSASTNGSVSVQGGEFVVSRTSGGTSLFLGTTTNASGSFEISSGSMISRAGVQLGEATGSGLGTFSVLGSAASQIGIGTQNSGDGFWVQNTGSTLKVGIDYGGVTKVFLDDVEGVNGTYATFESGSLLDVGYYNTGGQGGTWTVMEVENGDITDNGLAFAPGVDTSIWSFSIDNSGDNGLLTVTSTAAPASETVTWIGSVSDEWEVGGNWDNDRGPYTAGDRVVINSGTVVYNEATTPNLNSIYQFGGTLTISGGTLKATNRSNWDSRLSGTVYHVGGTAEINELEIGSYSGENGIYHLAGGDLTVSRGLNDYSLYLGGNHDGNSGGTGTLEITSGSMVTRTGVQLGHATQTGTGTFSVFGSQTSHIGIGSQNSGDGWWDQHAGSTLKVGIDYTGVTKIFIDDVEGNNATYATFASGALLDVDYYNAGSGGGTWIVMEVENGDITDNGLTFAPSVDTDIWSFSIDNSGANGILRVTAAGTAVGPVITVGNTLKQQMRYGIDYERLWYWYGDSSEKERVAEWSVVDCDLDYVRVAINSEYELTEGTYDESAYTGKIKNMMQYMQAANPDVKFFASPRPLNEAVDNVAWQPYPQWITGSTGSSSNFDFDEVKCSEYLLRYLILMKSYGFKITYMDLTNEWNYVTAKDVRDISNLFDAYLDAPWEYSECPGVTLTAEDMPLLVAPSAWNYSQGRSWLSGVQYSTYREALDIASCHNTDKTGTAQDFIDRLEEMYEPEDYVPEAWNTELHGWKSTSSADEVLTYAFMMECINAGFSGISGWLAIGTTNQGHSYIINTGNPYRNVKYFMFKKLTNTSHRGYALDVNEPDEFEADSLDANASVSALIRGNLMTVWVLNHSDTDHPLTINPTGRTIDEFPITSTRWCEVDGLDVEGETASFNPISSTEIYTVVKANSAYCYEILLEPESVPYTRIEAESYDDSNPANHSTEACSDTNGGLNLSNINDGNWTRYNDIDLSTADTIRFRVAAPSGRPDGVIEIRTGSETGTLIGRVAVPVTGGWQVWQTIEAPLDLTSGTHDLYLKYVEAGSNQNGSGAMFNLNWFELAQTETPSSITQTPISGTQITLTWDAVPGAIGYTVKRSTTQGGPYTVIDDTVTTTTFTDSNLSAGVTYYYVIVTRYANDETSDESDEVPAVPSDPIIIEDVVLSSPTVDESGENIMVSILNSGLGHMHQGQEKKDLTDTDWTDVGDPKPGNGNVLDFDFPIEPSDTKSFFRIEIWQQ